MYVEFKIASILQIYPIYVLGFPYQFSETFSVDSTAKGLRPVLVKSRIIGLG